MVKPLITLLSFVYTTNVFAGYGGYIGQYDDRKYGSLSDPEYNGVVKIINKGNCTGVFVSKNLILTNNHCLPLCVNGCTIEFWNGSVFEKAGAKIVLYHESYKILNGTDWALLLSDKDTNFYRSVSPTTTPGQILRGGFGTLRIIQNEEIPFLKQLYEGVYKEAKIAHKCIKDRGRLDIGCINERVNKELKQRGVKPIFGDSDNFKVQICNIIGDMPKSNKMVKTDCDSAGGDSGAPLLRGGQIMALNNSGKQDVFGDKDANANAIKTENFYNYIQYVAQKYQDYSGVNYIQPINLSRNKSAAKKSEQENNDIEYDLVLLNNQDDEQQMVQQIVEQRLQEFVCD